MPAIRLCCQFKQKSANELSGLITHHFKLDDIMSAYDAFSNAMKERALKVIISNP